MADHRMCPAGASVWDDPSRLNWLSGNWDADYRSKRAIKLRDASETPNCAVPNVMGYTTKDGEDRVVKVPEGKFEEVSEHVRAGHYEELEKLEEYDG